MNIFKSIIKKLLFIILIVLLVGGFILGREIIDSLPVIDDESFYYQLADPNEENGILNLDKKDYIDSLDELGPYVLDALISIEDRRFYQHNGIDYVRILGAVVANIQSGFGSEGGSTITQQLVKITYLDQNEKTLKRKIVEAITAIKLEKRYDKDEILYAYLNKVYYGSAGYGIKNASKFYFSKEVSNLGLEESAIITGIIQNPTLHSPINNPENMLNRAQVVLSRMLEGEIISLQEEKIARDKLNSVEYIQITE